MQHQEDQKFSLAAMMQYELRRTSYAVHHSRQITANYGSAPNQTVSQQDAQRIEQDDRIRVWRAK